jgi:hypothetical protein
MADDIEADLAQLRSEIARFVLEAIADDPQGDIARALAHGLQDAVAAQLSDTLPTLVSRSVASGWERALPRLTAAAEAAGAARGVQVTPEGGGSPVPDSVELRSRLRDDGPSKDPWAWARGVQGIGFIVGVAALFIAVAAVALVFFLPPRGGPARTAERGEVSQNQDGAVVSVDAEAGWARVLDQVQTWPAAERRAALDALCGQGVSRANCPAVEARRFVVSEARQRTAAAAAVARAMGELGYCAPPPAEEAAAANTATNSTTASPTPASDSVWDCLVYGAAARG